MPRLLDYGDRALLIDCESTGQVATLAEALRGDRLPGVVDVVAGARTVLVTVGGAEDLGPVRAALTAYPMPPAELPPAPSTAAAASESAHSACQRTRSASDSTT